MAESNFIDYVRIFCASGHGGAGSMHLHRAKYVPKGGPDGGDGGRGGHIILRANPQFWTLIHLRYRKVVRAENGDPGGAALRKGKNGADIVLEVPLGVVVKDAETEEVITEIVEPGQEYILCEGGRGGFGNDHFKSATNQTPRYAQPGEDGVEGWFILELKLLADVGLVGFPNAGKSTLLASITSARPKIANYAFTTLEPNLGIVRYHDDRSFVMADIPGIIEGASEGAGLGHDFLRHIDRCRLLVHVVDVSGSEGRDPVEDFDKINAELKEYSEELSTRPQIVVGNKADLLSEEEQVAVNRLKEHAEALGYRFFVMSAATHNGVEALVKECADMLSTIPLPKAYEADYVAPEPEIGTADDVLIQHFDELWTVEGPWMQRLCATVNFSDHESMMFFDRALRTSGIYARMEEMGVKDGDTVSIYDLMFEYKD